SGALFRLYVSGWGNSGFAIVFGMPKTRIRLARFLGLVAAILLLSACSGEISSTVSKSDRPVVLTTFTVTADLVRQVGGDHVDVESITKPGAEVHGYEPTPKDIAKASRAELIFDNGFNLEAWF